MGGPVVGGWGLRGTDAVAETRYTPDTRVCSGFDQPFPPTPSPPFFPRFTPAMRVTEQTLGCVAGGEGQGRVGRWGGGQHRVGGRR